MLPPEQIRPLIDVREEFREVLFAQIDEADDYDKAFADAYAQTLAYGLLIARVESGKELSMATAHQLIDGTHHPLLRATVRLLAEEEILEIVGWSLEVLADLINAIDPSVLQLTEERDPILYFYEDFLAEYDPELRETRGVYYTPPSVVRYQVAAVHQLLKDKFDLPEGLLNERVFILDPAVGTGTYLVACLQEAAAEAERRFGPGAIASAVREMLKRLYGFELMVGPYAVAHYRLQATAAALGAPPRGRLKIFLTDTLSRSHETPGYTPRFAYLSQPLTDEREAADEIKSRKPILVVLGNPPYDRTTALKNEWIYGELLDDFRRPVQDAGLGVHLQSLSDPFVYFYRWALWRLFQAEGAVREGLVSFITNRSWLRGEAFGGMRKEVRRQFDEGWILDLHGDSRAALPAGVDSDKNVFDIQAGVAIGVFLCVEATEDDASILYSDVFGDRHHKEAILDRGLQGLEWEGIDGTGIDPLLPSLAKTFKRWPNLREVFAFSRSGVKTGRDRLVVDVERSRLIEQLRAFFASGLAEQVDEFHENGGKTVAKIQRRVVQDAVVRRVTYRFLDERYLYNDRDFVSRYGPKVQAAWGEKNVGLYAMPVKTGRGQAAVAVGQLPDYHVFRGSYGGYLFPLYDRSLVTPHGAPLDPRAQSNIMPALVSALADSLTTTLEPKDVFHFVYAILACEQYSLRFSREIQQSFPHIPIPKDSNLFRRGVELGDRLTALHTNQVPRPDTAAAQIHGTPSGRMGAPRFADGRLTVCEGAYIEPVSDETWNYSVSGYPVLRRWLEARRDLDLNLDRLRQLLQIIYVLEETVGLQEAMAELLDTVLEGATFSAEELGLRTEPHKLTPE